MMMIVSADFIFYLLTLIFVHVGLWVMPIAHRRLKI